ncbi:hypothetical protein M9Y10_041976 [Tritrichomonas musculus]|uniref:Protein kinase domain-containing protein n=1 Tax=Tritrichomonas musculus TaxID=1915356 RepID=A0ABR2K6H2_9EUKA
MTSEGIITNCQLINIDEYDIGEVLVKRSYSIVYLASDKKTGKKVVIKAINKDNVDKISHISIIREINTSSINIPGIVRTIGYRLPLKEEEINNSDSKFNDYIIVSEFMPNKNFDELNKTYLDTNGQQNEINPTVRSKVIFGVAATMKKLHKMSIIHRDLKLSIILLDEKLEPQISHFGLARFIANGDKLEMCVGTPICIAPELFMDEFEDGTYGFPVDVYSYSILLYQIFSNRITFDDQRPIRSPQSYMRNISKGLRPKRPANIPDHYWELIQNCWKQNPQERPTFEEITEKLRDDKFALHEFGLYTNMDELHEYQERIDPDE